MARETLTVKIDMDGVRTTLRAFALLPKDASKALRTRSLGLSRALAETVRAAGQADGSQSAAVAKTVKAGRDRVPVITAGGRRKVTSTGAAASALLFGSEFGMSRRSGWYAARRYAGSPGRQFRPHRGRASYWFFRSVEDSQPVIGAAWNRAADDIIRAWSSGGDGSG
ncbi:MAG: hypothetical protein ACRCZP_16775 [Phycicoccus sp.]